MALPYIRCHNMQMCLKNINEDTNITWTNIPALADTPHNTKNRHAVFNCILHRVRPDRYYLWGHHTNDCTSLTHDNTGKGSSTNICMQDMLERNCLAVLSREKLRRIGSILRDFATVMAIFISHRASFTHCTWWCICMASPDVNIHVWTKEVL